MSIRTVVVLALVASVASVSAKAPNSGVPAPDRTPLIKSSVATSVPNTARMGDGEVMRAPEEALKSLQSLRDPSFSPIEGRQPYDVLALIADYDQPIFRATLASYPEINVVDFFNAYLSIPTLADLMPYDAVVTYPNYDYADMVATGDVLAAYVDAGGVVICAVGASDPNCKEALSGRPSRREFDIT